MTNMCSDSAGPVGNLQDVLAHLWKIWQQFMYDTSLLPTLCMHLPMKYPHPPDIFHKAPCGA